MRSSLPPHSMLERISGLTAGSDNGSPSSQSSTIESSSQEVAAHGHASSTSLNLFRHGATRFRFQRYPTAMTASPCPQRFYFDAIVRSKKAMAGARHGNHRLTLDSPLMLTNFWAPITSDV